METEEVVAQSENMAEDSLHDFLGKLTVSRVNTDEGEVEMLESESDGEMDGLQELLDRQRPLILSS